MDAPDNSALLIIITALLSAIALMNGIYMWSLNSLKKEFKELVSLLTDFGNRLIKLETEHNLFKDECNHRNHKD